MTAPLEGLRLLDLSTVVAGPFATQLLGHLGMEVIRISPPPAEPPWPALPRDAPVTEAEGFCWALARDKRSICLDLKHPEGRAVFLDLARSADIAYDNFRPGVMRRLGFDDAALAAANPRLIRCSISGFGGEGPWAEVGAYDVAVQALGGSMGITGTGDPESIPCRWGVPVGDIAASLYAAIGLMAALEEREVTGRGQAVEVALLDAQLALNTYRVPQAFGSGVEFATPSPRRGGAGAVPYGPFRCGDGQWIVIAVASNFWPAFRTALDLPQDQRFATLVQRQANQPVLDALLERRFATREAAAWEAALIARGVPAGRVHDIEGAFAQGQAMARDMLLRYETAEGRAIRVAGNPIRFAGEALPASRAPVPNGADTDAVLRELGLDAARIAALRAAGAVA